MLVAQWQKRWKTGFLNAFFGWLLQVSEEIADRLLLLLLIRLAVSNTRWYSTGMLRVRICGVQQVTTGVMCSAVVRIRGSELRISLIEVLRQTWWLRWCRWQSCGRGCLSLAPRSVMRRWSCCLIRWRYDFRKQLKCEVWPAHHSAGRAALISSSLLYTGVLTTCFPTVIQPWPGPVRLTHILEFKYKTPSSAINFWQHRQSEAQKWLCEWDLSFYFQGQEGLSHRTLRQLREQVWWLCGRAVI